MCAVPRASVPHRYKTIDSDLLNFAISGSFFFLLLADGKDARNEPHVQTPSDPRPSPQSFISYRSECLRDLFNKRDAGCDRVPLHIRVRLINNYACMLRLTVN